jgi:serine/threonine protein kinase
MICPSCKTSNLVAARFCSACGADLRGPAQVSDPVAFNENTPPQERVDSYKLKFVGQVADPLLGVAIAGKYRLDAKLGAGGMGAVYRATRLLIGDEVAVKILHSEQNDPKAAERFKREAQAAARLKHQNAVTILDFGTSEDGSQYLVMDLVEGESLRQIVKHQGPLTPSASVEIINQVCAALGEAHRLNIIHRDIKPDNIIVNATANGLRTKVLDFGIAKLRDDTAGNLTQTGSILGTPHYMSPEQCLGEELDNRSDIYSLGVVLFEMLTGIVPFNSPTSSAVVVQQVTQPPPPLRSINASISVVVEATVLNALEKQRAARPQNASDFARKFSNSVFCEPEGTSANLTHAAEVGSRSPFIRQTEQTVAMSIGSSSNSLAGPANLQRQSPRRGIVGYLAVGLGALILGIFIMLWAKSGGNNQASMANTTRASSPNVTSASLPIVTATASSERSPGDGVNYVASNLLDQSLATAWDEGVNGPGIGEWVRFDFGREVKLKRIVISPGYFKSAGLWGQNNRLASASFYFSDGSSRRFSFPDLMLEQRFELEGVSTSWVRMVIESIYPGSTDSEDTPISSISFDWEGSLDHRLNTRQARPTESIPNLSESEPRAGSWFVVLGSYPKTDWEKANQRLKFIKDLGRDARLVDTDNHPKFRPGLWAVVMGPYAKSDASKIAQGLRPTVPDAYIK